MKTWPKEVQPDGTVIEVDPYDIQRASMKTYRELLELAAKACGYWDATFNCVADLPHPEWNPCHDDGDCARMESACGIDVAWYTDEIITISVNHNLSSIGLYADHNGDKDAARRLASTRVAAQIGEGLK